MKKSVWHYFSQCCLALRYLHNENIIHRDIKSMNVFLTKSKEVKLGDLGVSRLIDDDRNAADVARWHADVFCARTREKRKV